MKIAVFENFKQWSLFHRISCYSVLGPLKHSGSNYKGPIHGNWHFIRFVTSYYRAYKVLSFHQLKVVPPVEGISWIEIGSKQNNFEHGTPRSVSEYRVASSVFSICQPWFRKNKISRQTYTVYSVLFSTHFLVELELFKSLFFEFFCIKKTTFNLNYLQETSF